MAGRANFGQISETEFSSLLQALSASSKGRLFLEEYRRRGRPEDARALLDSLKRIEATIATARDQLKPERIAEELQRVAMTLELALDGVSACPDGNEAERRFAVIDQARLDLTALAASLGGGGERGGAAVEAMEKPMPPIELTADQNAFFSQIGLGDQPGER